jgi:hypothetical protein
MLRRFLPAILLVAPLYAQAQGDSQAIMAQILQRLDVLEKENRELVQQVQKLREQVNGGAPDRQTSTPTVAATPPPTSERIAVAERRIDEQAQTKLEASQKFPIQLNGMLLFNAFANSRGVETNVAAPYSLLYGPGRSGATVRQTLIGLDFQGPKLPGDGRVNGTVMMDFWAGPSEPGSSWLRLRRAALSFDWSSRSFSVGQDKPIISPFQPDSLAEVGVPPLSTSGNFWYWLPHAKYEERHHLSKNTGFTGQVSLLQTDEIHSLVPANKAATLNRARPAVEGRIALWYRPDDTRRFEIGSGFHASTSHVAGRSADSRIGTIDWSFLTGPHLSITGTFYSGKNVAGLGSLGNGISFLPDGTVRPVRTKGGWTQFAVPLTRRLTLNAFGGLESDRADNYSSTAIVRDLTYATNVVYRLGPNVVVAVEGLQSRTRLYSGGSGVFNRYDLALGYLF